MSSIYSFVKIKNKIDKSESQHEYLCFFAFAVRLFLCYYCHGQTRENQQSMDGVWCRTVLITNLVLIRRKRTCEQRQCIRKTHLLFVAIGWDVGEVYDWWVTVNQTRAPSHLVVPLRYPMPSDFSSGLHPNRKKRIRLQNCPTLKWSCGGNFSLLSIVASLP